MQLRQLLALAGAEPNSSHAQNSATPGSATPGPALAPAVLALASGQVFHGLSIGAPGTTVGELVFNTSLTGYQEIITDPSYKHQVVTLTYPHIGNVGFNPEDFESAGIQSAGLVIRDLPPVVSNFRATQSLPQALAAAGFVAIAGVDTREITRLLRDQGAQACAIHAAAPGHEASTDEALAAARGFGGLVGADLARVVTCKAPFQFSEGSWRLGEGHPRLAAGASAPHVVAYDFGVKTNILRLLADRGCRITVVPATTSYAEAMALKPSGIFLSNGPGDPEPCTYAIDVARQAIDAKLPLFGICLGHQILALAAGAKTHKMKFGHHGGNHPVKDLRTGRVAITAQNHGFAVSSEGLPASLEVTHVSLFDGSIQGLAHKTAPAFCFQGHPEASPGPHDLLPLFDHFVSLMSAPNA